MHLRHHYVAFVGGRGIVPVLPLVETLLARDDASSVQLFYGNRDRASTEYAERLLALKDLHLERLALHFIMSREPQEVEWLNGRLDAHKVETLAGRLFAPTEIRQFLVCGPGSMNGELGALLGRLGVDAAHIRVEPYEGASATSAGAPGTDAGLTQVTVVMDGRSRTFSMQPREDTILEAAARAGIDLPFSCRAGVCSTCRTKLVRGDVKLAQNYALEDWELEQGFILACQAHAESAELEITYDEI